MSYILNDAILTIESISDSLSTYLEAIKDLSNLSDNILALCIFIERENVEKIHYHATLSKINAVYLLLIERRNVVKSWGNETEQQKQVIEAHVALLSNTTTLANQIAIMNI